MRRAAPCAFPGNGAGRSKNFDSGLEIAPVCLVTEEKCLPRARRIPVKRLRRPAASAIFVPLRSLARVFRWSIDRGSARERIAVNAQQKRVNSNITTIVIFYVAAAVWLYDMQERNLPALIQMFVEYFTLPLRYMYRPFYPLMKPFGWVVSEGADLPNAYGIVAGTAIWIFILIFVAYLFSSKPDKKRPHEEYWGG